MQSIVFALCISLLFAQPALAVQCPPVELTVAAQKISAEVLKKSTGNFYVSANYGLLHPKPGDPPTTNLKDIELITYESADGANKKVRKVKSTRPLLLSECEGEAVYPVFRKSGGYFEITLDPIKIERVWLKVSESTTGHFALSHDILTSVGDRPAKIMALSGKTEGGMEDCQVSEIKNGLAKLVPLNSYVQCMDLPRPEHWIPLRDKSGKLQFWLYR